METVIDMRAYKKWPGIRSGRRPAKFAASREDRQHEGIEPIGLISDRIVRGLAR